MNKELVFLKGIILFVLLLLFAKCENGQKEQSLHDSIPVFLNEIKSATKKNKDLWGIDLYGPMLFVDPQTRQVFANEPDTAGVLKQNGSIYTGILPDNVIIANTSNNWNGKSWAMIMLPLFEEKHRRIILLAHELFHVVQPSLGFNFKNVDNNHLDQKDGRIYLRLELEALKKAVQSSSGKEIQQHLTDAMTFRKYRNLIYPETDVTENSLELHEGIAEFTGLIIGGGNKKQTIKYLVVGINVFFNNPTFVRSFAYYTTPVYGYLLYGKNKNWNKRITDETNLTDFFIKEFNISLPADLKKTIETISDKYNGKSIIQEETEREEEIRKIIAEYKRKFIELPHFDLQFVRMNIQFDPSNIMPLEDYGTVYPNIKVIDLWGILTVENGALMSPFWDKISITNPVRTEDEKIIGDGWSLELTDGYIVEKEETSGNYKLTKK
jgi:hypothetical protein